RSTTRRRPAALRAADPTRDVLSALRRIIRATDLHSRQLAREVGLTTPQVVVLQAIRDLGEVTSGQLSRRVSLSQGTVTTILGRLDAGGLVERYRGAADGRVVRSRLTRGGWLLPPPDERHLRRHDGHELDVGVERQADHVDHGVGD